ncbi:MAG: type II toxin-antitoxin system HicA family toxin [Chloroflexota bacterium]|nr:type II toxin-antitoxin system HicA family toxin [Chloroflexota bacterium]MDE2684358.1 type II toxin-antitoxin system HicA family toxin [Chloroflexota bacterium]
MRELISELERAGFTNRGGRGNHRNFIHPNVVRPVAISGNLGNDARHYQVRAVRAAIEESRK